MDINVENIKELLDSRNIKTIIYVDDDFDILSYKENTQKFIRDSINNPEIDWPFEVVDDVEITLHFFEDWWRESEEDEIKAFVNTHSIKRNKSYIELILESIFPKEILRCIEPTKFTENYLEENEIELSNESQILILMDKYLRHGKDGMKLLDRYIKQNYVSCGLFSDKLAIENEISCWKDLQYPPNIYPISKKRFYEENGELAYEALRNTIWLAQISEIKSSICDIFNKSSENTTTNLEELDPASFDYIIIYKSQNEGCWEFEIIEQLLITILENNIHKLMEKPDVHSHFQELTKKIKKIREFRTSLKPHTELLTDLTRLQVYQSGSYINSVFSQISNGDIFEINGTKYMLVCQPCNLVIRKDGNRTITDYVTLLPIEAEDKNIKNCCKLYHLKGEQKQIVNFNNSIKVSPIVLDLVSYNKDGRAIIDLNIDDNAREYYHLMQENMRIRYATIKEVISSYIYYKNLISKSNIPKIEKEKLYNMVEYPYELATNHCVKISAENQCVDFGIKRIERYRDIHSQIVLNEYSNYLSRQALPTDLQYKK